MPTSVPTTFRLEVTTRPPFAATRTQALAHAIAGLDIRGVTAVRVCDLYFLHGDLDAAALERLAHLVLHDPVTEDVRLAPPAGATAVRQAHRTGLELDFGGSTELAEVKLSRAVEGLAEAGQQIIEVALHPGVTDSVADSLLDAAQLLGISGLLYAATGQQVILEGTLAPAEVQRIAQELLANGTIQHYTINRPLTPIFASASADDAVEIIPLRDADAPALLEISRTRRLALDLAEMQAIQDYYRGVAREPTDVELEMLAQTWSEHCVHKTFKATIDFHDASQPDAAPQRIHGLLKTYIKAATDELAKPWVVSAFVDNAGLVRFTEDFDLAFKVETHNHPSALEPFGGANTGVGGVIRDVMGVSARPIANTDVLCFGMPDLPADALPVGVLHPRRIAAGVVHGIEDYGNKMGIPTVNGAILYDPAYTANPLVFCGCLGILPTGVHNELRAAQPGDLVVVLGGRTGRDGLRGATFSSMEMSHETGHVAGAAVQIGHPIHEKQVLDVLLLARDERLYHAITDCGAGGLSSAVGEMAAELGADVELAHVPLKYNGLRPWEIWLSEAQERMVIAVPETHWPRLQDLCHLYGVEATALGRFTGDGQLTVRYEGRPVARLDGHFLHHGIPQRHLPAVWTPPETAAPVSAATPPDLADWILRLLRHPTVASKESVIRRYDHEVQGGAVVKPLVGAASDGPSDAAVLLPLDTLLGRDAPPHPMPGVALANGINPAYGLLDPYRMAWAAVDEALRNLTAVGADPDQTAILDNFCWGNPSLPDRLGSLVRCAQGCYDAALAYGAPFISGKDSLNNEYVGADGQKHAIPGTLLISALGLTPDITRTVTMDFKEPGNLLYLVGATADELGGSLYHQLLAADQGEARPLAGAVPAPVADPRARLRGLHQAIRQGLVRACHDCSEGGLAVAVAEMALAGRLGADVDLARVPTSASGSTGTSASSVEPLAEVSVEPISREPDLPDLADDRLLFAESLGRFVVEVTPAAADAFIATLTDFGGSTELAEVKLSRAGHAPIACIGQVTDASQLIWRRGEQIVAVLELAALLQAWKQEEN